MGLSSISSDFFPFPIPHSEQISRQEFLSHAKYMYQTEHIYIATKISIILSNSFLYFIRSFLFHYQMLRVNHTEKRTSKRNHLVHPQKIYSFCYKSFVLQILFCYRFFHMPMPFVFFEAIVLRKSSICID